MVAINDLRFAYPKHDDLFSNLSLELKKGSITGLLGANGAGKTTLLKLLSGLLASADGSIKVNDRRPFDRNVELLKEIYLLPEEYFLPQVRIKNFVKALSGFYPKFDQNKFASILTDFELNSSAQLHKLSHGQKKKFLVSFALASNCALLILDEPTNGLDIPSKAMFRRILAGSIEDQQLVVISTHQITDVENLIDNIVILKDGSVVFHESTAAISDNLMFRSGTDLDGMNAIYSEPIPGGVKSIARQSEGIASDLDIELLFNAVNSGIKFFEDHEN